MQIGDKCKQYRHEAEDKRHKGEMVEGVCVYIHPQRRFFTLRFDFLGGSFLESFPVQYRKGES